MPPAAQRRGVRPRWPRWRRLAMLFGEGAPLDEHVKTSSRAYRRGGARLGARPQAGVGVPRSPSTESAGVLTALDTPSRGGQRGQGPPAMQRGGPPPDLRMACLTRRGRAKLQQAQQHGPAPRPRTCFIISATCAATLPHCHTGMYSEPSTAASRGARTPNPGYPTPTLPPRPRDAYVARLVSLTQCLTQCRRPLSWPLGSDSDLSPPSDGAGSAQRAERRGRSCGSSFSCRAHKQPRFQLHRAQPAVRRGQRAR